jgi:hypothetical protein
MQHAAKIQNDFNDGKTVVPPTRNAIISVRLVIVIDVPAFSIVFAIFSGKDKVESAFVIFLRHEEITKISSTPRPCDEKES